MSLAEEMLANMSVIDDSSTYLAEEEPHIVINESRQAIVPNELKTIAVTGDKDIETVTFDCVRYWDGNDLSTFAIYLNYVLPDSSTGTYIPDEIVTSDGDEFYHFDWKIKNNITKKSGQISFAITAIKTKLNDGGVTVVEKQWSSIPNGDCSIALGLDISNVPSEEESSDVVAQLSAILEQIHADVDEWIKTVVVQTSGTSETAVMSQKAVTNALRKDSLNLFNKNTALNGYYIHYPTGNQYSASEYFASDFIKIDGSKEYFFTRFDSMGNHVKHSQSLQVAFYDENCDYISGLENEWKFTTPENAQYLRFGTLLTYINKIMLSSVILTEYTPYADSVSIDYDMIDLPVVVGKKSPNIVNPNKVKVGYYVGCVNGNMAVSDNFCATAFIKTEGRTNLFSNKNYVDGSTQCAFYDKYMTYLSGEKDVTTNGVAIPEGAEYVRITFKKADVDIMFSFEAIDSYKPYGAYLATTETKMLRVKLDGTGDFTNLRTCFESITDASPTCQYIVEVYEGTYDIRSYYTDEEWNVEASTFIGLTIPDYVTLRGVGNRERIVLTAYDTTKRQYVSTLNLKNTSSMENLTVKAERLRYVIHDDFATTGSKGYERHVENCHFISSDTTYAKAYGAGFKQGAKATFKNCIFDINVYGYSLTLHNNVGWKKPSYATFENCRFGGKGVSFGSLNTNANGALTYLTVIGCKANTFELCEENAEKYGSGILFKATGYANNFTKTEVVATDGVDYLGNIDFV